MYPIIISFGDFVLPSWHFFYVLGAVFAYFAIFFLNSKSRCPQNEGTLNSIFFWAYLGGYFGARCFAILVEENQTKGIAHFLERLLQLGPMTFYGGFFGSTLSFYLYLKFNRKKIAPYADVISSAGWLALFFGRIGCFLNGDDYGSVYFGGSDIVPWWIVQFPNDSSGLPRYPIQLIESFFSLFLFLSGSSLIMQRRLSLKPGTIALTQITLYAVFRFFAEYFRGDYRGAIWGETLSPAQQISLLIIICCNLLFAKRKLSSIP